jgi:hypothetical protein
MISDTSILALTMLLVWGVMNCLTNIIPFLSISSISFLSFVIISGIPSLAINHILIWRKERYLKYFNQFEHETKKERKKWMLITLLCIISIGSFFILSFSVLII